MAPANVIVGHERIPLYEKVLFSAPDAEAVDSLRREVFGTAMDDGTIEMATLAAEVCGSAPWLGRYIAELVASSHPADQARGVTIAGFREVNQYTDQILAVNRGGGFLGEVAAAARKCYRRAAWAQHWLDEAAGAYDPTDFWRFSRLAEGVADARLIPVFRRLGDSPLLKAYGGQFFERLKKAAEERSKKRAETLFGLKAPEKDIARIIRDCLGSAYFQV
jgi:hypothetical protein